MCTINSICAIGRPNRGCKKHVYDTELCMCYRQTQYRLTYTIRNLYMLKTDFTSVYSIYMMNNSVHARDRFHVCIQHIHKD